MNLKKKPGKENIEDILALTPVQEGMLFHYLKAPDSDLYFEQLCLQISGRIEVDLFEKAWNYVIENNEMLRTAFRWEKLEKPVQIILKNQKLKLEYFDFSGNVEEQENKGGNEKLLAEIKARDREEKFDLWQVPFRIKLCKVEKDRYEIIISNHHILYDGWSNGIILEEFSNAYFELLHQKTPLKPVKGKFKDYIRWLQNQDAEKQDKFWKEYLEGFDTLTEISVKRAGGKEITGSANCELKLKKDFKEKLESFTRENKITLAALLYSAYGILLQKYNNSSDVIFGTTVSGRSAKIKGIDSMIGLFINTLPLRVQSDAGEKISTLLKKINDVLQIREEYETTPLVNIKKYSRFDNNVEIFDSIVVIENYPLEIRHIPGNGQFSIDSYSMFEMTNYDLTVAVSLADDIEINLIYNSAVLEQEVIERLSHHFCNLLKDISENPTKEMSEIEILSAEEKRKLLFDFNSREAVYPETKTIQQLFEEQVDRTPASTAVVFKGEKVTFKKLDEKSNLLAYFLFKQGLRSMDLVALMVDRSLEMITGILGILKTGSGYVPLNPKAPLSRNKYIMNECDVKLLLTAGKIQEQTTFKQEIGYPEPGSNDFHDMAIIAGLTESVDGRSEKENQEGMTTYSADNSSKQKIFFTPGNIENKEAEGRAPCFIPPVSSSENIAYVIFTSGSTGRPKGVPITHANLCPLLLWGSKNLGIGSDDRTLQNLSYYFDWSVWEIFITLTTGASLYIVPDEVLLNPEVCIDFITAHKISVLHVTPTQYQHTAGQGRRLDTLKYLFIGAEKLTFDLVERSLASVNENCRLFNMYGPTEATIISAVLEIHRQDYIKFKRLSSVPIGKPVANIQLLILDKYLTMCPVNVHGELVIAGTGVAAGYLNNPELTAEKFLPSGLQGHSLHSSLTSHLYRTGDLVRWLADGNIEFLGRMDYQVKIRGFRIEPGEIENRLMEHEEVKEAVVLDFNTAEGEKYLCAYIVARGKEPGPPGDTHLSPEMNGEAQRAVPTKDASAAAKLRQYLSQTLPDYMIPAHFMFVDRIPLNPNAKVDRRALPVPGSAGLVEEYVPPRNELEEKLVTIWSEVLKINRSSIGIDTNFFGAGGHSLKATMLVAKIHKELNVNLNLSEIFRLPTIRALAPYIGAAAQDKFESIKPAVEKDFYPLSAAQERLYILQQVNPRSTAYNIPVVLLLEGDIRQEKFTVTFRKLIERHESLRTSFEMVAGKPRQKIHRPADIEFELDYYSPGQKDHDAGESKPGIRASDLNIIECFIRPFDLSQAPLLRAGLIGITAKKNILMVDIHHIISDGTSIGVFTREFIALYSGEKLPPLTIQYKDFSEWQNNQKNTGSIKRAEKYWLDQFRKEIPMLKLPSDYPRPRLQDFAGDSIDFKIGKEETGALKRLENEEGVTLFMVLLAITCVLLSKLSGQEDIVIGVPTLGRRHAELQNIIGMFVGALAIRNYPAKEKTFKAFLHEVKQITLAAFENQDYQFEDLVERLEAQWGSNRNPGRNPLFDVVLSLQDVDIPPLEIPGLKLTHYRYKSKISKFDQALIVAEQEDSLTCTLEYSTKLFKPETIEIYIDCFKNIIAAVLADRDIKLEDISVSSGLSVSQSEICQETMGDFGF